MRDIPLDEDLYVVAMRVRDSVLNAPNCSTPARLRRDAYERGRRSALGEPVEDTLDPLSAEYAELVANSPQRAAVDKLTAAGRSDDEIFELTVAAAVGSATARLEAGLSALRGRS
jgi:hypothetical protein